MHTQAMPPTAENLHQRRTAAAAPLDPTDLLTDAQVAQLLDVSPKTLATWRSTGRYALPFLRIGARIRYRKSDVLAWLESRRHGAPEAVQGDA